MSTSTLGAPAARPAKGESPNVHITRQTVGMPTLFDIRSCPAALRRYSPRRGGQVSLSAVRLTGIGGPGGANRKRAIQRPSA